jgi:hypothetical protein
MRSPRRRPSCRPSLSGALFGAAVLAAAFALCPATTSAATVQVAGPAGTRITVDGTAAGTLPLAGPLTLAPGTHELVGELPGMVPHRLQVQIERDDEWRQVAIRPLPYSRRTAVLSNVVLAGMGQRYLGHRGRGLIYTAVEAGGLLTALVSEIGRSNANDEYLLALDAYHQAINQDEVAAARLAAEAKRQDVQDAADRRDLGLMVAAGAVAVSMVDAWLSFGHVTSGAGELPPVTTAGALPPAAPLRAFHTAVRLSF